MAAGFTALAYPALAALLGAVPVNPRWSPPDTGITVHVATNGVHSGIVLPASALGDLVRPGDLADPRRAGPLIWIGWGERHVYLGTPRWQDARPGPLIAAAFGSDATLIHVDHLTAPPPGARPLRLRPHEYRRLVAAIRRSFAPGRPRPLAGYGPADVFYPATGRYSLLFTCNGWTGAVLRDAGVRTGWWTPLSATVMQWR
ncbi:DUF2459 domain-containing protein [Sphingomonas changnyeongensis]|uniref:DUF2459 domain-containing protein n=2 Tax=Sphingomonas changnyeongensis TaxID=2698679 RepID=A0A7Z2NXU3_9SPHN|nr:DUF2459 domain-containing protein [Sphingomonas changnyeongensis]